MSVSGKFTVDTWCGQDYATVMIWRSFDDKVYAQGPWLWLAMRRAVKLARKKGWVI